MARTRGKKKPISNINEFVVIMPVQKKVDMSSKNSDYRKDAIHAAQDFGYGDEVIQKIKDAKSDDEVSGIMQVARHQLMKKELKRGSR